MGSWRKTAETIRQSGEARHNSDNRHNSPQDGPNVPIVPNVPADPVRTFKLWATELDRLDWRRPLHGLSEQRWGRLLEDSWWVLDKFGQQAARDGWTERDLFGVLPGIDAWGGIADRLRAARSLVLSNDRAGWRCIITGKPEGYARGNGDHPPLTVLWESGE